MTESGLSAVNGAWNDKTEADITVWVTLYDKNGNMAADGIGYLTDAQSPAVGNEPDAGYVAGGWAVEPSNGYPITEDSSFTYEYRLLIPVSAVGEVVVVKVDEDSVNTLLSGVEFQLYRSVVSPDTYVGTYITDTDGRFRLVQTEGLYYLVETKAHEGYTVNSTPIAVTVVGDAVERIIVSPTDTRPGLHFFPSATGQYTKSNFRFNTGEHCKSP